MTHKREMQLGEEELREIGNYVQTHLPEWMERTDFVKRDTETRESLIRLESELKGQRELLAENMRLMEKRFDQVDKRFEQLDKRFEEILHYMDKRFEQMDKRFESSDRRFASVEQRLINIEKSLRTFIYSSFSFTAAAAGVVIAVLKFI